ncbi:MAG: hypothetical protein QM658_11545 [Gordonia sp. (in: high G+C Gram-positive bacteria)]
MNTQLARRSAVVAAAVTVATASVIAATPDANAIPRMGTVRVNGKSATTKTTVGKKCSVKVSVIASSDSPMYFAFRKSAAGSPFVAGGVNNSPKAGSTVTFTWKPQDTGTYYINFNQDNNGLSQFVTVKNSFRLFGACIVI